ncbi:MAG: hypothetical protein AAGF49_06850, partial [Pseudomonadota bacterium]
EAGVFLEVVPLQRLDELLAADRTARALVLYEGAMASLIEAMARGVDPSSAATAWAGEARAILRRVREFSPRCLPLTLLAAAHSERLGSFLSERWGFALQNTAPENIALENTGPLPPPAPAAADPVLEALAALALTADTDAAVIAEALAKLGLGDPAPAPDAARAFEAVRAMRLSRVTHLARDDGARPQTGSRPAVLFADQPAATAAEIIHTDDDFEHPAFYPPERLADGTPFRFMGREKTAFFRTRTPFGGPIRITAVMPIVASVPAFEAFRVTVNGKDAVFVETFEADGAIRHVSTFAGPEEGSAPDDLSLTLHAPVRIEEGRSSGRPRPGAPRLLSVGVRAIEVAPLSEADLAALAAPTNGPITISFDETFAHPAFHSAERSNGIAFRWMGRANEASLPVKLRRSTAVAVKLFVPFAADQAYFDSLTLSLDGDAVPLKVKESYGVGGSVLSAEFPARTAAVLPFSTLTLRVDTADHPPPVEGRTLLLAFEKIVLEPL